MYGATAVQKKQSTTVQKKGKRAVPDPITTTLITAGVKFAVDLGKSLFGDKITETTTFIEQSMIPSTTRALMGTRPISLNMVNRKQPEQLKSIDLTGLISEYKKYVPTIISERVMSKLWLNLGLLRKMSDEAYMREMLKN